MKIYVKDNIENKVSDFLDKEKSFINIIELHKKEYNEFLRSLFPKCQDIKIEIGEEKESLEVKVEGFECSQKLFELIISAIMESLYDISNNILFHGSRKWEVFRNNTKELLLRN